MCYEIAVINLVKYGFYHSYFTYHGIRSCRICQMRNTSCQAKDEMIKLG